MKILMLNQKTGMFYKDIETYVSNLKIYRKNFTIFPSSIYASKFVDAGYSTGLQNIAEKDEKNQTGEITARQASEAGINFVIIGHSERRINQKEGSKVLINKFNEAIKNDLDIVYCVGESLVEYKLKDTDRIILKELNDILSEVKIPDSTNLYIAYEPIWAIGTGLTPTEFEIKNVSNTIINYLTNNNIKAKILYGGSVNDKNIEELSKIDNIDGFLVGGASNDYKKVIEMCEILMNSTN
ncbi:MAG: triose-phosphate isomerase [Bacilli bacterium]|nr:triose-phosphate isomerase [Bacilli bacterium]